MKTAERIVENAEIIAKSKYGKSLAELNGNQLHFSISRAVMAYIQNNWKISEIKREENRRAYYFSAEFLVGRMVYNNLFCLGILEDVEKELKKFKLSINSFEESEDSALGNGGLGRLAACFLDSAATIGFPLDGYGIRYKYGLFRQKIENGFQVEEADDWDTFGDPWTIRDDENTVTVDFKDFSVKAVPYNMPIIGYNQKNIGTLRLWQAEATEPFDFNKFNGQNFKGAVELKNMAEDISRVLYPNDEGMGGKILRFRQQYFFCSASLQDILKKFKKIHGNDFSKLHEMITIQLNDTHPTVSIPELIRLLGKEGLSFKKAFVL